MSYLSGSLVSPANLLTCHALATGQSNQALNASTPAAMTLKALLVRRIEALTLEMTSYFSHRMQLSHSSCPSAGSQPKFSDLLVLPLIVRAGPDPEQAAFICAEHDVRAS